MFQIDPEISLILIAGTGFMLFIVTALLAFVFIHHNRMQKLNYQMQAREQEQLREIEQALEKGETGERKRLSEELHDGVGANLTAIKYSLEHITSVQEEHTDSHKELLQQNIEQLNRVINEVREISHNLQPEYLNQKGLSSALYELASRLNNDHSVLFKVYIDTSASGSVNDTLTHTVYRIAGELFTNVLKHAEASEASIQLSKTNGNLVVIVEDNGRGMTGNHSGQEGIGLINIKNRVAALEGSIDIDSSSHGTTVIISLPLHETSNDYEQQD